MDTISHHYTTSYSKYNLGFDDGAHFLPLAQGRETGQNIGIRHQRAIGWRGFSNFEYASPSGEFASFDFVLSEAGFQVVQT